MPVSFELPGGWAIRMSAVSVLDSKRRVTEPGIAPPRRYEVDMIMDDVFIGRDTMLDFAVNLIK